jgi:hypothetical protein
MRRRQPIWGISAGAGLVCGLLALDWLFQGMVQASGMMALGSLALFGWAAWLADHERD